MSEVKKTEIVEIPKKETEVENENILKLAKVINLKTLLSGRST